MKIKNKLLFIYILMMRIQMKKIFLYEKIKLKKIEDKIENNNINVLNKTQIFFL